MRLETKRKSALMRGTMQILEISEPITIARGRQAARRSVVEGDSPKSDR